MIKTAKSGNAVVKVVNRVEEADESGVLDLSDCSLAHVPDMAGVPKKAVVFSSHRSAVKHLERQLRQLLATAAQSVASDAAAAAFLATDMGATQDHMEAAEPVQDEDDEYGDLE